MNIFWFCHLERNKAQSKDLIQASSQILSPLAVSLRRTGRQAQGDDRRGGA
jgi:hypothetical protein